MTEPPDFDLKAAAARLYGLGDIPLTRLCLLYFPKVHGRFAADMRRNAKINLLLVLGADDSRRVLQPEIAVQVAESPLSAGAA